MKFQAGVELMITQHADTKAQTVTVDAVVIRANGDRVNLGTVAHYDSRWYRRALFRFRRLFGLLY
jgi:hypothetical protein